MVFTIYLTPISRFDRIQIDEKVWGNVSRDWKLNGIESLNTNTDNKPVPFLALQRLLQADRTVMYTRTLNIVLIASCAILIYSITKRYESFLFVIIPVFLNSMWLTVEIIETLFVLLAIKYKNYSGLYIGLAMLFRPYAILYSVLLKRKQIFMVAGIGIWFTGFLLYQGLFFSYLNKVIGYGSEQLPLTDYMAMFFLIPLAILGTRNKEMFKYGLVACIPLLLRSWGHYFLPGYAVFLTSYLKGDDTKRTP